MKSATFLALLHSFLSASSAFAAFPISSVKKESNLPTVPNKFIIEVDELSNIPNVKRSFTRSLDAVYSSLQERALEYEVTKEFDVAGIFTGAAMTLHDVNDAAAIEKIPGVKAIRPVREFRPPRPVKMHIVTGPNDPEIPAESMSTHILTGVDKLHAQGIIGTGIKIGIIDSGIDYNHPTLGGGMGAGFKVAGGYDFVGDAYTGPSTDAVPDNDPHDNCNGHGTHVAGIIGANPGNDYKISGVAHGATISAYRVFGCEGSTTDEIIVDALCQGVRDGQDILTLSLGGSDGWTGSTSSVVASRIAASGKIVTIAAGNDGDSGSWYTSSPGNGINAISVASVDNTVIPLQNATLHGVDHAPVTYFSALPLKVDGIRKIYATSNDSTVADDACRPLPEETPDLAEFVVLIRRGSCTFVQKLTNAAAKGAKAFLIYNNAVGFSSIAVDGFTAALIQAEDGQYLVEQFAAGAPIAVEFPQSGGSTDYPDPHGGLVSSFSTYGPTNDFHFKPAVAAPGGNIMSTLPLALGGFGVSSGTSMATPFVAGSAALLLSVKGKSAAISRSAKTLFETTAKRIGSTKTDGDPLQTITQQGAGLINVFDAIFATTIVSPGELVLNDTANFRGIQTFTVKNTGSKAKQYKLTHVAAGTALTIQPGSISPSLGPVPLSSSAAGVTIFPSSFTVRPGATQIVIARFTPPTGLDASTYPVYSGFIEVTAGAESTHVSYLGLVGNLKDKQIVDNTDIFFGLPIPAVLNAVGEPQTGPVNYTFAGGDNPSLLWRLVFGTPALRVDLVDAAFNMTTTLNKRGLDLPFFTFPHANKGGSFAQVKTIGPLVSLDYIPRHDEDTSENGDPYSVFNLQTPTFANGTIIRNGAYRILIRALRVTGNPKRQEDYESWLSPIVGIQA
ncbi:pyrolysin [Crassisporium funariophilum]|nr:pyrolysin [Crassisporium funariophilum]